MENFWICTAHLLGVGDGGCSKINIYKLHTSNIILPVTEQGNEDVLLGDQVLNEPIPWFWLNCEKMCSIKGRFQRCGSRLAVGFWSLAKNKLTQFI